MNRRSFLRGLLLSPIAAKLRPLVKLLGYIPSAVNPIVLLKGKTYYLWHDLTLPDYVTLVGAGGRIVSNSTLTVTGPIDAGPIPLADEFVLSSQPSERDWWGGDRC